MATRAQSQAQFNRFLRKAYTWYLGGFVSFIVVLAIAEQLGLPRAWIGYTFLFATIALYAGIGIMSRTAEVAEYYVAGRRVPAMPMKDAALIQSAPVAMPLNIAGTRRPAT